MTTLYGIKNCDTVKKALSWLRTNDVPHSFHDFRVDGLSAKTLNGWLSTIGKDKLINKRSTTWKQLSESEKALFADEKLSKKAIDLVLTSPTLIKRPVLETTKHTSVGFNEATYSELLD